MLFKNSYSFHTNTNTYFEYPYSAIRNEYHCPEIRIPIRFLITPIRLKPSCMPRYFSECLCKWKSFKQKTVNYKIHIIELCSPMIRKLCQAQGHQTWQSTFFCPTVNCKFLCSTESTSCLTA